jgi:hypothetical protein
MIGLGFSLILILFELYFDSASLVLLGLNSAIVLLASVSLFLQLHPASSLLRQSTVAYLYLFEAFYGLVLVTCLPSLAAKIFAYILTILVVSLHLALVHSTSHQVLYKNASLGAVQMFHSAQSNDEFVSPLLSDAPDPFMSVPELTAMDSESLLQLTEQEKRTIAELKRKIGVKHPEINTRSWQDLDWLKLAWSRQLDANKAEGVFEKFHEFIGEFGIKDISINKVRANFSAGFSVLAGKDLQGRSMLWQRMCYMTPGKIPLDVGIKSTWLALDAGLSDAASNRLGVALVYDFSHIGFSNITLNISDIKNGVLACGAAHPSHISRVVFLNAPFIFSVAFNAAKPFLPDAVVSVVEFLGGEEEWYRRLCTRDQLPRYLRTPRDNEYEIPCDQDTQEYLSWLFKELEPHRLLYEETSLL